MGRRQRITHDQLDKLQLKNEEHRDWLYLLRNDYRIGTDVPDYEAVRLIKQLALWAGEYKLFIGSHDPQKDYEWCVKWQHLKHWRVNEEMVECPDY